MSERGGRRRGYHHGDLKAALLDAARALIAERGPLGFTMAEAARRAGVSASAPYRHFDDRNALLRAVALEGHRSLARRLDAAWRDPHATPLRAFDALGRAYLAFAREEPASYAAMFDAGVDLGEDAELSAASDAAFGVLVRAAAAVLEPLPPETRPPATMVALHVCSLSHGVADLFGRGRAAPASPEELLESAVGVYLTGLGVLPPA